MNTRVLVIEDDPKICELLRVHMRDLGCDVELAHDGETGLRRALQEDVSLIILDLNLPKLSGFDVCREIRKKKEFVPLLMLTAKSGEFDKVLGLELGADDYLTKPFSVLELTARVRALLRRSSTRGGYLERSGAPEMMEFGDLLIDNGQRQVRVSGKAIDLSITEFQILLFLASRPGRVFTRDEILQEIWGFSSDTYGDNVTAHINRLRRKIELDANNPRFLHTVRGIGYKFAVADEQRS